MPSSDDPCLAIFDHDGVLVDTLALHQEAWVEYGKRAGLNISAEFVRKTFGMTNPSMFRLLGTPMTETEMARHSDGKEACYRELAHTRIRLMDGVRELLDALSAAGVRLAIGSSGVKGNLELTVRECGLEGRFASMVALEDITHGKPDPEVFLKAAARAGVEPARSAVFEDAPFGIQAARRGMYAIGVTTSHPASVLWDAGANEVVESLAGYEVAPLVQRLRSRNP